MDEIKKVESLSLVSLSPFHSIPSRSSLNLSQTKFVRPSIPNIESKGFSGSVTKEVIDSISPEERHRQEVIFEWITTEHQYVEDLKIILNVFLKPIRDKELLNKQEIGSLFGNVETIFPVHERLLEQMKELQKDNGVVKNIAEPVLLSLDLLKHYAIYCSNQPTVVSKLNKLKDSNFDFCKFLEETKKDTRLRMLDINSFLIKPMQRICKYPLLLKELLRHTSMDHPEYETLNELYKKMGILVDSINERTRKVQQVQKLLDIQESLEGIEEGFSLLSDQRILVREGTCKHSTNFIKSEVYLFLFNDLFMVTKQIKKGVVPKFQLSWKVETEKLVVSDTGIETLDLFNTERDKIYGLQYLSSEDKKKWFKDFDKYAKTAKSRTRSYSLSQHTSPLKDLKGFSSFSALDHKKMLSLEKQMVDDANIEIQALSEELKILKNQKQVDNKNILNGNLQKLNQSNSLSKKYDDILQENKILELKMAKMLQDNKEKDSEILSLKNSNDKLSSTIQDYTKLLGNKEILIEQLREKLDYQEKEILLLKNERDRFKFEKEEIDFELKKKAASTLMFYLIAKNEAENF